MITSEDGIVKNWKPLFQLLMNLLVSFACALLLRIVFSIIVRPHGTWVDVGNFGAEAVFGLSFWSIRKYHQKKNTQTGA
jgi:hypothetical protein